MLSNPGRNRNTRRRSSEDPQPDTPQPLHVRLAMASEDRWRELWTPRENVYPSHAPRVPSP